MNICDVVILNYNTKELLKDLLPLVIENSKYEGVQLVVADNASTDGSAAFVAEHFPDIKLINIPENRGFAGGYNYALKQCSSKYFLLLNSDIEPAKGWLDPILNHMEADEKTAIAQPKIKDYYRRDYFEYAGASGGFIDKFGFPFCRGRIFGNVEKDVGQYDDKCKIFWASGAAFCIRSSVWNQTQGLDEMFFAHMEEIDLCWRVQNLDFDIYVIPESVVYHMGGATLSVVNPRKSFLNFRNGLYMLYKNMPLQTRAKTIFYRKVLDGMAACLFLVTGKARHVWQIVRAHRAFDKTKDQLALSNKEWPKNGLISSSVAKQYFAKGNKLFSKLK